MNLPAWNPKGKQTSLKQWVEALNEEARRQFLEAGTHVEIFFIFGDEGPLEVVPIVGMAPDDVVSELRRLLRERNGYAFIHVAEATALNQDSTDEAGMLLVHAESRDGLSQAYCNVATMQGDKKLLLDAVAVDGLKLQGPFTHLFGSA